MCKLVQTTGAIATLTCATLMVALFVLLQGYPTHNDLIAILKIARLDGPEKWLNGFYGPGYTALALLIGPSVYAFGAIQVALFCTFLLWQAARCCAVILVPLPLLRVS